MRRSITDTKGWFYLALGCVAVSILSLFLPILKCGDMSFNIIDLVTGNPYFVKRVINGYTGPIFWDMTETTVTFLALIAVAALICAIIGLVTLRAQRPNNSNFILTFIGLVGILIPSLTAILCVVGFGQYYPGGLSLGIAPIISPVAILISIGAVIRRKNIVAEEIQRELKAKGLIYEAGDLE